MTAANAANVAAAPASCPFSTISTAKSGQSIPPRRANPFPTPIAVARTAVGCVSGAYTYNTVNAAMMKHRAATRQKVSPPAEMDA